MTNEESQANLGTAIINSIASEKVGELTIETTEIVVDSFLELDAIKNIPVYQFYKFFTGINDLRLMKKTYAFLFEHRNISLSDRVKFLSQFETSKDIREFGELVIALLDRVLQIDKATIIGKLSRAQILGLIDRQAFLLLAESTDRLFLQDLEYLREAYKKPLVKEDKEKEIVYDELEDLAFERLTNAGLMSPVTRGLIFGRAKLSADINSLGKLFVETVFEDK